jgi:hypothetical protein
MRDSSLTAVLPGITRVWHLTLTPTVSGFHEDDLVWATPRPLSDDSELVRPPTPFSLLLIIPLLLPHAYQSQDAAGSADPSGLGSEMVRSTLLQLTPADLPGISSLKHTFTLVRPTCQRDGIS